MNTSNYPVTSLPWSCSDPLPKHQWLLETPLVIIEENELPQWKNADELVRVVKEMGGTHVRYPAVSWGAHWYGKSEHLPSYFDLPSYRAAAERCSYPVHRDLFGEVTKAMHDADIRVMAYMHFGGVLYRDLAELHPEWLAIMEDGKTPYTWADIHNKGCITNESFVSAMLGAMCEVIESYHPDSIYFDGPIWYTYNCQCDACRRKYKEMFGAPLPSKLSSEDGTLANYFKMRDTVHLDIIQRAKALADSYGVPLLVNTETFIIYPARNTASFENAISAVDGGLTTEVHRNLRFYTILESIKVGESLKRVSYGYCPPGPYESFTTYSDAECEVFGYTLAAHRATPMLEPGVAMLYDGTGGEALRRVCAKIEKNREIFYRTQPVKELAVMQNNHPRTDRDVKTQLACASGFIEALAESHRHFDVFTDAQISYERLRDYRALVIPSMPFVDAHQERELRRYVAEGGTLLVGRDFSRLTEDGEDIGDFAMADLLGVHFSHEVNSEGQHIREYRETAEVFPYAKIPEAYIKPLCDLPGYRKTDGMVITTSAVVGDGSRRTVAYTVVDTDEDTEILAELYLASGGTFGAPFTFPEGHPPALVRHKYGKGQVYYLASDLSERYLSRHLPKQRRMLAALADLAVGTPPLVDAPHAPSGLYLYMTEDTKGRYLHLINYCGSMLETGCPVEDIVPLYDITLKLRPDRTFGKITAESGAELSVDQSEDGYTLHLSRLDIHEIIILPYES